MENDLEQQEVIMTFEVLTAVNISHLGCGNMLLVDRYQQWRNLLTASSLWNVGTYQPDYMALYTR